MCVCVCVFIGAAMFAKRKQKSEKWVVPENTAAAKPVAPVETSPAAAPTTAPNATTANLMEQNQKIASVQVTISTINNH